MRLLKCWEIANAIGIDADTVYHFACEHRLPLLSIAGRYMIEAGDLEMYRMARAKETG